jgi:hypothetical protein
MADTGGPTRDPSLEARVGRLESDLAEVKAVLNRLAPRIDEMYGFLTATLPGLATKAEWSDLRAELKSEMAELKSELKSGMAELRMEMIQRPTRRQSVFDIFAIVALIGAILTIAARLAH